MEVVVVGKIGAPYGVRGWVKVHSFTEPLSNLFTYPLMLDAHRAGWQSVGIEAFKQHGTGFVAKLQGVDDRDQAALITNAQLAVYRESFPELDAKEYYWTDLMGLTVYNQENIELGQITDFFATGANDVLVVQGKKEYLIPFVPDMYIIEIDLAAKRMLVDWDSEF